MEQKQEVNKFIHKRDLLFTNLFQELVSLSV